MVSGSSPLRVARYHLCFFCSWLRVGCNGGMSCERCPLERRMTINTVRQSTGSTARLYELHSLQVIPHVHLRLTTAAHTLPAASLRRLMMCRIKSALFHIRFFSGSTSDALTDCFMLLRAASSHIQQQCNSNKSLKHSEHVCVVMSDHRNVYVAHNQLPRLLFPMFRYCHQGTKGADHKFHHNAVFPPSAHGTHTGACWTTS